MSDGDQLDLVAVTAPIAAAFEDAGHHLYLVGGAVRDHLLGHHPDASADLDLTTEAMPAQIKEIVAPLASAVWTTGERFGTIGCLIDGRTYEVTTHRAERYDDHSRKPDVDFSMSIDDDLSRRDFTINAMARRLPGGELVDPLGGRADLAAGRLRTPLDPHLSFSDDPLRMLRAARFVANYDVELVVEAERAIVEMADRLAIVSTERIRDELVRLLAAPAPGRGLELLDRTGLARLFLPELAESDLAAVAGVSADPVLRLAVILGPGGAEQAAARGSELRLGNADTASLRRMVGAAERLDGTDDESIRRFVEAAGADLDRAVELAMATGGPAGLADAVATLIEREGTGFDLPVSGGDLIEELRLEPGPAVGELMRRLHEERLRSGPMTRVDAIALARRWSAER